MDLAYTDYEEHIAFDLDDPDFSSLKVKDGNFPQRHLTDYSPYYSNVNTPNMSLTSITSMHPGCGLSHRSQSYSSISSLDETNFYNTEPVLSIEELRTHLNSCFTCGVSWYEDHVSLDCGECGGYSLERPCPMCDGRCQSQWKRDLTMSHTTGKAKWAGQCGLRSSQASDITSSSSSSRRTEKLSQS